MFPNAEGAKKRDGFFSKKLDGFLIKMIVMVMREKKIIYHRHVSYTINICRSQLPTPIIHLALDAAFRSDFNAVRISCGVGAFIRA